MSVAMRAVASREKSSATILALDFSHQMLQHGLAKLNAKKIQPVEADALHLPLADSGRCGGFFVQLPQPGEL